MLPARVGCTHHACAHVCTHVDERVRACTCVVCSKTGSRVLIPSWLWWATVAFCTFALWMDQCTVSLSAMVSHHASCVACCTCAVMCVYLYRHLHKHLYEQVYRHVYIHGCRWTTLAADALTSTKVVIMYTTSRHGTARHGTARHGTARHGTARHGTARHGTARHDTHVRAGTRSRTRKSSLHSTSSSRCARWSSGAAKPVTSHFCDYLPDYITFLLLF